ncbi:hypothetical protein ABIE89_009115 [Bradyrhizobium niftali]|uniref:hypothetical protein n=1 Tax=Bradyrhizobium niftali TaxID=2560055 RepID=UPI003838E901
MTSLGEDGWDDWTTPLTILTPKRGLEMVVRIFCEFWDSDPAVARLHGAMAIDQEFAQALVARNERRLPLIGNVQTSSDDLARESIRKVAQLVRT